MKKKRKQDTDMIKQYWKDVEMIPLFIDSKKFTHKECRDIALEMFGNLSVLLEPTFLDIESIKFLYSIVVKCLEEMIYIDVNICACYTNYVAELLSYYKAQSNKEEFYEVSNNIYLFLEEYKIIYKPYYEQDS
jgi:hypothetical protein